LGKWKWNAYLILEKNISILAKVTQVSDVAHGPLVKVVTITQVCGTVYWKEGSSSRKS
jgi:hypothetical protein